MKKKPRKAIWCWDCKHFDFTEDDFGVIIGDPCKLNHKPRFYVPKDPNGIGRYGWKRRCEDFQEGEE